MSDHHLIFVPGICGTTLHKSAPNGVKQQVWSGSLLVIFNALASDPDILSGPLSSGPVIDCVSLMSLWKRDQYAPLIERFSSLGYNSSNSTLFGYDWRQDLEVGANKLAALMRDKLETGVCQFKIVAHSMGALLVRCCMRLHEDLRDKVTFFGQIGAPVRGSVVAYQACRKRPTISGFYGSPDLLVRLFFRSFPARLNRYLTILNKFPSVFQLLPPSHTRPLMLASDGELFPALHPEFWPKELHANLVRAGVVHTIIDEAVCNCATGYFSDRNSTDAVYLVDDKGTVKGRPTQAQGDGVVLARSAKHGCQATFRIREKLQHDNLATSPTLLDHLENELKK